MRDYAEDMNSQITFDEFLLLHQKKFVYDCTYDPELVHEHDLYEFDHEDPSYADASPEHLATTDYFREQVLEEYTRTVRTKLLSKEWFTKVEALEDCTDYWEHGVGPGRIPDVNVYVPVTHTIMPRPKFRDYNKRKVDQTGADFTLKTKQRHTVSPATSIPESLKPEPFSPAFKTTARRDAEYAHGEYQLPKMRWGAPYRLNKTKRNKGLVGTDIPSVWRFSTMVKRDTPAKEQKSVRPVEQEYQPKSLFSQLYTYSK